MMAGEDAMKPKKFPGPRSILPPLLLLLAGGRDDTALLGRIELGEDVKQGKKHIDRGGIS
jgi:hypothetical protein